MKCQVHMRRVLKMTGPILALRYRRAAQWDESHGFSFAAAMEWRRAAELCWITPLANCYWREWERIMQLPRRLAVPIGAADVVPISVPQQGSPSRVNWAMRPKIPHEVMVDAAT